MDESSLEVSVNDTYRQRFNRWFQPRWRCVPWWSFESRSAVRSSLLRLLAMAHAHRLAIAPLVRNFAYEHRGLRKLQMLRFARRLESGTPLVEALEQTPDVLSEQDVLTLRFASQTGTLGSAYEHLSRTVSVAHQERATLFRQFVFDTTAMLL